MQAASRPVARSVHEDQKPPAATFKTSLRDWQARYKAERAARAAASGKIPSQAART
jgi:hypothetical protein